MRPPDPDPPQGCTLVGDDRRQRVARWTALLRTARVPAPSSTNEVRIELGDVEIPALMDLAEAERRCCSYLTFVVDVTSSGVAIEVDGPGALDWYRSLAHLTRPRLVGETRR